jgi:transcription termination/antitermination protein NusG
MADNIFDDEQTAYALEDPEDHSEELAQQEYHDEQDVLEEDEALAPEEIHHEAAEESDDGVHGLSHEEQVAEPLPEAAAQAEQVREDPAHTKLWYIVHAYSGFEQKVAESLKTRAQAFGFADRLGQILIPTEEVIELRNGKKVTSKRLLYPGYVLVQMEMDDELWHAVKSTPRVTGFVGGGTKPVPLTADEVNAVLYRQASSAERPRPKMSFEKNETVKIIDGPFTNFSGKVDEINTERNTLRVMVTIFGRSTPVELDFLQVEKI